METGKELKRQHYLARVKLEPGRIALMREIAPQVGLSANLWPKSGTWRADLPDYVPRTGGKGKTTRMLLAAVADAELDKGITRIVAFFAHRFPADEYGRKLREWLTLRGLGERVTVEKFVATWGLNALRGRDPRATRFYCDNAVRLRPVLERIGQLWTETP